MDSESDNEAPPKTNKSLESSSDTDDEVKSQPKSQTNALFNDSSDDDEELQPVIQESKPSGRAILSDSDDDISNIPEPIEDNTHTNNVISSNQLNIFGDSSDDENGNNLNQSGMDQEIQEVPEDGENVVDENVNDDEENKNGSQDNTQWQEYSQKTTEEKKVESSSSSDSESEEIVTSKASKSKSSKTIKTKTKQKSRIANSLNSDSSSSSDSDSEDGEPTAKRQKLSKSSKSSGKKKQELDTSSDSDSDSSSDGEDEIEADEFELPKSPRPEEDVFLLEHLKRQVQKEDGGEAMDLKFDAENDENPFDRPLEEKVIYVDSDENPNPDTSDFDWMLSKQKKKRQRRRNNNKDSYSTEVDDVINDLMKRMADASNNDKDACLQGIPAIQKLKLLPAVTAQFQIRDNQEQFIENGVMTAIADWLTPLPNGALPNLKIRTTLLEALVDFPACSTETLKASGVGKAINRLSHHPKEMKENKITCRKLTKRWCKQIFQINDTGGFSKQDRQERDAEQYRIYGHAKQTPHQIKKEEQRKRSMNLKITDRGFISRARVPQASTKDYLIRPKSAVDLENLDMDAFKKKKLIKTGNAALMDKTKKRLMELDRKKKVAKCDRVKIMKF